MREKYRVSFLTVNQTFNLNVACKALKHFGVGTFHVGSSLERPDYHDVDLRCILLNKEFDAMFSNYQDPKLLFINAAISEWLAIRTGLPIDFQFQRITDANEQFPHPEHRRNGIGI